MTFTSDAISAMMRHCWPGNVRELGNVVERAVLMCKADMIGSAMLSMAPLGTAQPQPIHLPQETAGAVAELPADELNLTVAEKQLLVQALERARWNVSGASRLLGVSRDTLRYRMEKFALHKPATTH